MKYNRYLLTEDRLPPKLKVVFSPKITKDINDIDVYNNLNNDGIYQWYDYIETMKNYISNPVIAFDYTNRHKRMPNGTRYISDFDYNIGYTIKTNSTTNSSYVYIFKINLNTDEFGLKLPPTLNENKKIIPLTESHIRQMVRETLRRYLKL